ncbi:hypothetical protein ACH4OY_13270 [Micromonospora rubida]|uniref:Uncharacterized protein n=1 Tax=Micromonospora rubida TaxID=2697657 RepID=A0ABW7SNX8_9ACTN
MDATTGVPVWHTGALARPVWGGILTVVPGRVLWRRAGRPAPRTRLPGRRPSRPGGRR